MLKKSARCSEAHKAILQAFAVVLLQVCFLFLLAPGESFSIERFLKLLNWDSRHYESIASRGYVLPLGEVTSADIHEGRANVVFFPGYPLAARGLSRLLGISVPWALLLVAQLSSVIFWSYFQLLLRQAGAGDRSVRWTLLMAILHPAAFFVVCGYTEAMFLACALGYMYWTHRWLLRRDWLAYGLAGIHGFVMCATRIVGFALLPYPYMRGWREKAYLPALILGGLGALGGIAFFAWCQHRFDDWSVYFQLEEVGWRNHRLWFAILDPRSYIPRFFFEHDIDSFNRASLPFTAFLFGWAWWLEKGQPDRGARFPLYLSAFVLFYIPLTGKANANMDSMIRYTFPVYLLLLLCLAPMLERAGISRRTRALIATGAAFSFAIQVYFAIRFLRGGWVA
jgi:hypothetical protein